MSDFLAMGGYPPFVWGSYAVAAVVLAGLGITTWRRVRSTRATLDRLEAAPPPAAAGVWGGGPPPPFDLGARRRPPPGSGACHR